MEPNEQLVGRNIRDQRRYAGLTAADLASRAGLSKALISRIENGTVSPSIATLLKIARELQVPVSSFFEGAAGADGIVIVRRSERKEVVRMGTPFGYTYQSLAYKKGDRAMEPFLVTYPPAAGSDEMFDHEGEEFVFVLQGRLRLVHGDHAFELEPGDSAYLDPSAPHRGYAANDSECVVLSVVTQHRGRS